MANCIHRININGHVQEFSSDEELHSFLRQNKKSLSTVLLGKQILFSTEASAQDLADDKLTTISNAVKFDPNGHKFTVNGVAYTPVTKYISEQRLIPEFKMEEWEKRTREALLKEINLGGTQKYTAPEAQEIINTLKSNWETQSMVGTSWHDIAKDYFRGDISTPQDIALKYPQLSGRDYLLKKYIASLDAVKTKLKRRHGDDAIFRAEVEMYDPTVKVAGIADLLVIDKDGKVHIYDYKTSIKEEGQWSQAKELTINYQLATYRQILRRQGLDVDDALHYIPVQLHDIDFKEKSINDFDIKPDKSIWLFDRDRVMLNLHALLPYDFSLKLSEVTSNKEVYDFLRESFNYESARHTTPDEVTVDEAYKKLIDTTPKDAKYYKLYNPINPRDSEYFSVKTPEEKVRAKLKAHVKYLNEYQRYLPKRFYDFVTYAKNQLEKGETIDWESHWSKDPGTVNKISTLLNKYISDPSWSPLQSDALYDLNAVAFENKETNQIDLISLTNNNLDQSPKLLRGKTLLGNFVPDHKVFDQVPRELKNGDIELIKLVAFIKANKDIFKNKTIGSLYAMNIYKNNTIPRVVTQTVDALIKQFDVLTKNLPDSITLKNQEWVPNTTNYLDAFIQDIQNMFEKDAWRPLGYKFITTGVEKLTTATEREEKIKHLGDISQKLLDNIAHDPHTGFYRQPDATRLAYLASQAILQLEELPVLREADMLNYGNFLKESKNASNPTSIINQAYANVVALTGDAMNNTTHAFNAYKERVRQVTSDLYKAQGSIMGVKLIGYNLNLFDNLFERTPEGKKTMRFKNPATDTTLTAAEAKFINEYGSILMEIRADKLGISKEKLELAPEGYLPDDLKFNIPLMRASELTSFVGQNYKEWFKNYFRDIVNPQNIYENDTTSQELLKKQSKMYNFFDRYDLDLDARQEKLDRSEFSEFESDLEAVLDMYTMMHSKEREMNKIMPVINAQKLVTMLSEYNMFEDNANTASAINDYVGTVLFDKNLIAEESKNLAIGAQVAKSIVSKATIGFNAVSGFTEFFTGWGNNITRAMANKFDSSAFGGSKLLQASALVFGDVNTNKLSYENVSLGDSLNEMFRISDMNLKELVHKVQTTSSGLTKFGSHYAYWFQSFPTYTNRMTMFVAQMIHDGIIKVNALGKPSTESSIQMIDGKMVYNEKLDPRFSEYLNDPKKAEHLQTDSYKDSRAKYLKMLELLGQEPGGLKEDGSLARPYDNRTRDSIKQSADDVHGNYDKETKTRLEQLAFGKIFLQFKTYLTAKRNRWYMGSHIDQRRGQWVTEWKDGVPMRMWQGRVTEGIWQTLMALGHEVKENKGNIIKSWDGLHASQKQNIGLMLGDILQFGIYSMMLGLMGYAALKKDDPLQAELLRGADNANKDLWIGNAITSIGGAKNPIAVLSWGSNVLDNTWGVLTGRTNAGNDLLKNIAIYRSIDKVTK